MSEFENEPTYKLFIEDLKSFVSSNGGWYYKFAEDGELVKINTFQIQVKISKVSGVNNEVLIVSDETGKAKATRTSKVPGVFSWVKPDVYCSIVGNLLDNGKLPHVNIIKLAQLNNSILEDMWPIEVVELKNFISKKIAPDIMN